MLETVTYIAQLFIGQILSEGSIAVDATAGNGKDTLFLAERVGNTGHVYTFDIQTEAIEKTKQLLQQFHVLDRCTLICDSHHKMKQYIPPDLHGHIRAVMFNLGYLPGGNHSITTRVDTTMVAVKAAYDILNIGGRISIVVYPGHEAGKKESHALLVWSKQLHQQTAIAVRYQRLNASDRSPYLLLIEKRKALTETKE